MTALTETYHDAEFLISEEPGGRSREQITLLSGSTLDVGTVLGAIVTATSVTGAAFTTNAASTGTIGTLSAGTGVQLGVYQAICIEPATDHGTFMIIDPRGKVLSTEAVAGSAYTGQVNFTISDGATDFTAGEGFNITVIGSVSAYDIYDPSATDGTQRPKGILYRDTDASSGAAETLGIMRDAVVNADLITWISGASAAAILTAQQAMEDLGIIFRSEDA
jgi:hypothetical protein